MRVVKFFRIDVLRIKQYWYMLLMPSIFVFFFSRGSGTMGLFGIVYGLFMGIIFSTVPFNLESRSEIGFLQMLPSRPGEQVLGHFLFGFVILSLCLLSGIAGTVVREVFNFVSGRSGAMAGVTYFGVIPIFFGIALVMTGVEEALFSAFRFENAMVMQLVKIAPAFLFFFGASMITDFDHERLLKFIGDGSFAISIPIFLVCVAVYAALAWAGWKIAVKRNRA